MNKKTDGMVSRLQPETPLVLPVVLPGAVGSTTIPGPVTQDGTVRPAEYYVLTLGSPKAMELEEKLNDASRDGWSLFQIIRQAQQMLLVFWRQSRSE